MRMIDGDAILNSYCDDCHNREYCEDRESKCSCYSDIEEVIVNAKEIDYESKKHGWWIVKSDGWAYCSNCGYRPPKELIMINAYSSHFSNHAEYIFPKYCNQCGTNTMREARRGE